MSTSFKSVYDLNKLIKNDPRLANLDDCELNSIRFGYLKFAISYFMYDCRKDLNDRTDPVTSGYEFNADGVDNQFILDPAPSAGSKFVVYTLVENEKTQITGYTFSTETNVLTTDVVYPTGTTIIVKAYTIGEFNDDLDIRELNILAEGMNVPYIEEAKNDENVMKYIVSGKSLRFFSQANHITAMNESVNNQKYNMLDSLISEYSYKGNEDNYNGLSGRGGGY